MSGFPCSVDDSDAVRESVARLPIWRGKVNPVPLKGGITNANFLVEDGGRKVVVRVGGDNEAHGIVRKSEAAASHAAFLAGVAPQVIHQAPGVLVLSHVEGRTFAPEDVRNPDHLNRIVELVS